MAVVRFVWEIIALTEKQEQEQQQQQKQQQKNKNKNKKTLVFSHLTMQIHFASSCPTIQSS